MTFPNIPNVTPSITIRRNEVANLLLASIAFEELGLAHMVNAEAEKLQAVLGTLPGLSVTATSISQLLSVNENVNRMLKTIVKNEMLLQFKLEDVLSISTSSTATFTTSSSSTTTSSSSTTTSSSSTTTTTTTSTMSTTTPVLLFEDVARATGVVDNIAVEDTGIAIFNSTVNPNITGANQVSEASFQGPPPSFMIGGVDLGRLPDYLMVFTDGSAPQGLNWHGSSHGYVGDVAVDGIQANLSSSGTNVPYAGTIFTNDNTLQPWQTNIIDPNTAPNVPVTQAFGVTGDVTRITNLENDLALAFAQINSLADNSNTLPAPFNTFNGDPLLLNGLNTQNGINEVFVLDIFTPNSGADWKIQTPINITGDPGDVFILRWDTDRNFANGYQGQVDFESGGAIVPLGGLKPSNFIHVAGDIHAAGGSAFLDPSYPTGPRYNNGTGPLIENGSDWAVAGAYTGGFFTGYWLTTGDPANEFRTTTGGNLRVVGGLYTSTTALDFGSGWSGVYISPNPATLTPAIDLVKEVSVDNCVTFFDANVPPGPVLPPGGKPCYRYTVTNTGPVDLSNVVVVDQTLGIIIGVLATLASGASHQWVFQTT